MRTQRTFFGDAALGRESKVLDAVRKDGKMLDLQWTGSMFQVQVHTINDLVWVFPGCTAIMAASSGGHSGLVEKLASLGANVGTVQ